MKRLVIILLLSCAYEVPPPMVPDELMPYYETFMEHVDKYQLKRPRVEGSRMQVTDLPGAILGSCNHSWRQIKIDSVFLHSSSFDSVYTVFAHECGHCYYALSHSDSVLIMKTFILAMDGPEKWDFIWGRLKEYRDWARLESQNWCQVENEHNQ